MPNRVMDVGNTPIRHAPTSPRFADRLIRIEPELVSRDVEADVERLIKVRRLLKRACVPVFCRTQLCNVINHRTESLHHQGPPARYTRCAKMSGDCDDYNAPGSCRNVSLYCRVRCSIFPE